MSAVARIPGTTGNEEPDKRSLRVRSPQAEVDVDARGEAMSQLVSLLDDRFARIDRQVEHVLHLLGGSGPAALPTASRTRAAPVAISCLGPFQFHVNGVPVDNWRSSKARSLFQYMVNHRGRPIPRDTLIQALWPNPDAIAAGTSLKVAVHALRQTLGQAVDAQSFLTIIAHDCGYQLNASHFWIDVEEFDRCYALGRSFEAQGRTDRALVFYSRAADLYQGDFLEESTDDWPMFRREALKDQYLYVLTRLARAAAAGGDYQSGIFRCQQLLAKDCCREDAYRLLMICHARLGQRSRVRTWYELCVQTLRAELDCAPEPETERLYRVALAGKV